jgi:hypothetical protein
MATLTDADYTWIIEWVRHSQYKNGLKNSGFSKTQLKAGIQAIETYSVGSYNTRPATSLKSTIETAMSATPTLAQNEAIWYAWAAWKAHSNETGS